MTPGRLQSFAFFSAAILCLLGFTSPSAPAQSSNSSSSNQSSSSSQMYAREKAPSLIDPAGPTISLIPGRYQYQGTLHKVRMSFLEISASEDPFAGPYLSAVPIVRMIVRPPRILPLD